MILSVYSLDIQSHILVGVEHTFKFVFAKQAIVYKNTVQIFADGMVYQRGRYRRINSSRQRHDHFILSQFVFKLANRTLDKGLGGPVLRTTANVNCEVFQHVFSFY
jgi:hypothetical protein